MSRKNSKDSLVNKKEGNVIHINYGQRQVANELKRILKNHNKEEIKEKGIPYNEYLKKLDTKYILNRSAKHFIRLKKKGMGNEEAHIEATDEAKSEAIKLLGTEIVKIAELFHTGKLTKESVDELQTKAKQFIQQVRMIDKNVDNRFTHYLTDMEMIEGMDKEKRDKLFGENNKTTD